MPRRAASLDELSHRVRHGVFGYALALTLGCGSAAPPPAPPATPTDLGRAATTPERPAVLDAGVDCVHARVRCDLALCSAELHNECEAGVACDLSVLARCGNDSAAGEAKASAHEDVAPDTATTLEASADCQGRPVLDARVTLLRCK